MHFLFGAGFSAPASMGHIREPLGLAVALNTAVFLGSVWILRSTAFELRRSVDELIWPEQAVCPHEPTAA